MAQTVGRHDSEEFVTHPRVVSSLDDFATGRFERILPDAGASTPADVKRILMCSGKIYFELERERDRLKRNDVAILRLEQFYPLADETLDAALRPYRDGTPFVWVQEEPENMGAWRFLKIRFGDNVLGVYRFRESLVPDPRVPQADRTAVTKKSRNS
jgi:2-oxoglutarate dehydrogenase E1 component